MKAITLLHRKSFLVLALALSGFVCRVQAQKQDKQALMDSVKAKVEAKTYFFKANSANSKRGRNIDLTVDSYGINVTPLSVKCDLPFYGEAYGGTGGYGTSGSGPINFESTEFTYEAVPRKKGGWTVTIRPKSAAGVQEVILSISEEGYTNVTVTSTNRSVMNYYGNLR